MCDVIGIGGGAGTGTWNGIIGGIMIGKGGGAGRILDSVEVLRVASKVSSELAIIIVGVKELVFGLMI